MYKRQVLCSAIAYVKLVNISARLSLLKKQDESAKRLLAIEVRRVVAGVDNSALLTRAKLLEARTRMEVVGLEIAQRRMLTAIANLTGIPVGVNDLVPDSVPLVPTKRAAEGGARSGVEQMTAIRDVAQLEYATEQGNRLRVTQKMMLGKASIGDLVAAHIQEDERLSILLDANLQVTVARLEALDTSCGLESWAVGLVANESCERANAASVSAQLSTPFAEKNATNRAASTLRSIMITPAVPDVPQNQSRQYSAIAIYNDGHAIDASSNAQWECSDDTKGIVSARGLFTGLSMGQMTISATLNGVVESRKINVTAEQLEACLLYTSCV